MRAPLSPLRTIRRVMASLEPEVVDVGVQRFGHPESTERQPEGEGAFSVGPDRIAPEEQPASSGSRAMSHNPRPQATFGDPHWTQTPVNRPVPTHSDSYLPAC